MNFSIEEKHPGFIRHSEGRSIKKDHLRSNKALLKMKKNHFLQYPIANEDRSIGARLSGEIIN